MNSVPENAVAITVLHILSHDDARQLYRKLQEKFPRIEIEIDEIGPVIGSHLGPGGVGVCSKW